MAITIHFVKSVLPYIDKLRKKHEGGFTMFSEAAVKFTH